MVQNAKAESLRLSASKSLQSLESLSELLSAAENLSKTGQVSGNLQKVQRQVLLDSFSVKKFHRDYKEWENSQKETFINDEIKPYNKKIAEMSRVYGDFEASQRTFDELKRSTKLHTFNFSVETLQGFENGALLDRIIKDENGEYPKRIAVSKLFSIDINSHLPSPSFPEFNRLVNLEYRLRLMSQIKHEVLLRARGQLVAKTTQWASRDVKLNSFLTRELAAVADEIQKVKASEQEDLKYYDEDYGDEEEEEEEEEENEEIEENDVEENEGNGHLENGEVEENGDGGEEGHESEADGLIDENIEDSEVPENIQDSEIPENFDISENAENLDIAQERTEDIGNAPLDDAQNPDINMDEEDALIEENPEKGLENAPESLHEEVSTKENSLDPEDPKPVSPKESTNDSLDNMELD